MKYKSGMWSIRGLTGSVQDAELKSYEVLNILVHYGIDLAILTETKTTAALTRKNIRSVVQSISCSLVVQKMGKEIIMDSPWRLKLHFGQIGAASGSLSAIESSLDS